MGGANAGNAGSSKPDDDVVDADSKKCKIYNSSDMRHFGRESVLQASMSELTDGSERG